MSAAEPLMEAADLHVWIEGSHILQGVSFTMPDRGVTALMGRNGVGKTTTVKALLGLVPRTGRVVFDGVDITTHPTYTIVSRGIGYVPEERGIFAALTVAENLRLAERHPKPRYELVHELFPELRRRSKQMAGTLSGGQQQMVAIGRTLLNRNRLIVADEPTKGLAPKIVSEVADVLARRAGADGLRTIVATHDRALADRFGDVGVRMEAGRVVDLGPIGDVLARADEERGSG